MTRYYIKNAFLQRLCCGDIMITRKKVVVFLTVITCLSCVFMTFVLFTVTRQLLNSDNRYMAKLREHGNHYKNKLVDSGSVYLKPIQDKVNSHLNSQQYDKKIKEAYDNAQRKVALNVETFRGKADTIIKQVKKDPSKYVADTGRQIADYAQDTGYKAGETMQDLGKQSLEKMQEVHKDTKELINDMRANPDKYSDKAKQQYKETVNKLGEHANNAVNGVKDTAAVLQQKAAQGLEQIERQIDRARS